ncbi:MAG: sugar phosphate isomerase/epimerase, partial [Oscillospiraceae bacterium]|nr:sugar phosphate isomerase/epimerase [Oscillospiraceae bacterium]
MLENQLACQLYTLRDYTKTAENLLEACKKVSAIGYPAVQVSGIGPIPPEQVREIMEQCGLKICVTHVGLDGILNDPAGVIRTHNIYDCSELGIGCMPGEYWGSYEAQLAFAKKFAAMAPVYAEAGLQLSYHNHAFEFTGFPEGAPFEAIAEIFIESGVNIILDLYWLQVAGVSPIDWINRLAGHVNVAHFKDMTADGNRSIMAEVGEGNMNYPAIIQACDAVGLKWAAVEQDECRS